MPKKLIAWHGEESEEYFAKIALATPSEIEAAEAAFGSASDFKEKPIFSIDGSKGVLNISGALSPNGPSPIARFFGFTGTGYNQINEAIESFKTAGVTDVQINGNSGGGYVDGCDQAWQSIFSMRETAKVTFINRGMTASAMYYLATAANEILSDSISNFTGSIGVKVAAWDFKEYYEKMGIKERVIVSDNASKKSPSISDESGRDEIKSQINAIERIFYARIAEGRGITIEKIKADFGQGSVMVAADPDPKESSALSNGLIDGIIGHSIENNFETVGDSSPAESKAGEAIKTVVSSHLESESVLVTGNNHMAKLNTLLAGDAEAKADYEREIASATQAAINSTKVEISAEQKRVSAVAAAALSAEKSYGPSIQKLAVGLVAGTNSEDALVSAMSAVDAVREEMKSTGGASESQSLAVTAGENADPKTKDNGIISSEEQIAQYTASLRKQNGIGV